MLRLAMCVEPPWETVNSLRVAGISSTEESQERLTLKVCLRWSKLLWQRILLLSKVHRVLVLLEICIVVLLEARA